MKLLKYLHEVLQVLGIQVPSFPLAQEVQEGQEVPDGIK